MKLNRLLSFLGRGRKVGLLVLYYGMMSGCDSGATDIGIEGFDSHGAAGRLDSITLYADSSLSHYTSFMDSVTTGSADRLYLGSVDNYDFKIAMQFVFPSDVDSVEVTGAQLKMTSTASYGSGGTFTAAVHPIKKKWTVSDLRWSRFDEGVDTTITFSQTTVTNTPSAGTIFSFPIPNDTVQHWIYANTDTNRHNYGILIDVPIRPGFAQQFYSGNNTNSSGVPDTSLVPRLEFTYRIFRDGQFQVKQLSVTPVTISTSTGGVSYSGGEHGYVYRDRSPQPGNTITVGGGVIYHALLNFNTDRLPASATVSNAVLLMRVDPAGSYHYNANTDSIALQAARVETSPAQWKAGDLTLNATDYFNLRVGGLPHDHLTDNIKRTDDTLRLTIGAQLQSWVTKPASNYGLEIFSGGELSGNFRNLYRVRFINDPAGDRDRSPKIIIYFTLPPSN